MIAMVRLGEWTVAGHAGRMHDGLEPVQDFHIEDGAVTVHEDYEASWGPDGKTLLNDIALVRLPRPARIADESVGMICLAIARPEYRAALQVEDMVGGLEGRNGTVVGWGYTSGYDPWNGTQQDDKDYGVPSRTQQKLVVPILSNEECTQWNTDDTKVGGEEVDHPCSRCVPAERRGGTPARATPEEGSMSR